MGLPIIKSKEHQPPLKEGYLARGASFLPTVFGMVAVGTLGVLQPVEVALLAGFTAYSYFTVRHLSQYADSIVTAPTDFVLVADADRNYDYTFRSESSYLIALNHINTQRKYKSELPLLSDIPSSDKLTAEEVSYLERVAVKTS